MASRARSAKNTSHEMTTPMVPTRVCTTAGPCPAMASRSGRPAPGPASFSISARKGTYSPNGTRRTLS